MLIKNKAPSMRINTFMTLIINQVNFLSEIKATPQVKDLELPFKKPSFDIADPVYMKIQSILYKVWEGLHYGFCSIAYLSEIYMMLNMHCLLHNSIKFSCNQHNIRNVYSTVSIQIVFIRIFGITTY